MADTVCCLTQQHHTATHSVFTLHPHAHLLPALGGEAYWSKAIEMVFPLPGTRWGIGPLTQSLPEGKTAGTSLGKLFLIS